jgi:hypothetical protein
MQMDDVPVYVTVTAATRGGLLVQYNHLEGFIPISHLGQVRAGAQLLGAQHARRGTLGAEHYFSTTGTVHKAQPISRSTFKRSTVGTAR